MKRRLLTSLTAGLGLALGLFATPAIAQDMRIALVVKALGIGFFEAAAEGAEEAAAELGNVEIIYTGPTVLTQPAPFVNRGAWSVGNQLTFKRADLITELKWLAPMQDSKAASIDFGGIGGQGALSIQLGGRIKFGGPQ